MTSSGWVGAGDLQWGTRWGAGGSGASVGNATAGPTDNDSGPFFISGQQKNLMHEKHDEF